MKQIFTLPSFFAVPLLLGCFLRTATLPAQVGFEGLKKSVAHANFKIGAYVIPYGGVGISAAFGSWTEFRTVQPSFNLSVNLVATKANLGNRDRYLTNWQINTILTPMVTYSPMFDTRSHTGLYQEVNPFYFGNLGAVYARFRHSITLGSNFVVMPRALGRNITTFRNRTQQLIYLGLRSGGSDWDLNLNLYEDFFGTDNALLQGLADNFDRFYTGGGNLQLRFQHFQARFYSDIYTGNFPRDMFDSPDLYSPYRGAGSERKDNYIGGSKRRQRHPRYVAQDPGQKLFNSGRNFFVFQASPKWGSGLNPAFQAYAGLQGGKGQMKAQDWIHGLGMSAIDKIDPDRHPEKLHYKSKKRGSKPVLDQERLHRFFPAYEQGRFITGGGFVFDTLLGN